MNYLSVYDIVFCVSRLCVCVCVIQHQSYVQLRHADCSGYEGIGLQMTMELHNNCDNYVVDSGPVFHNGFHYI